jgi:hypothetical protein
LRLDLKGLGRWRAAHPAGLSITSYLRSKREDSMPAWIVEAINKVFGTQIGLGVLLVLTVITAWWNLSSELKKLRTQARYQTNRDLLSKRFETYGALWKCMQATAIYTEKSFGPSEVKQYFEDLSKWYFSDSGGLFLSERARDFYFALQDLLHALGPLPEWHCDKRPANPDEVFAGLLLRSPHLKQYKGIDLKRPKTLKRWQDLCVSLPDALESLIKDSEPKAAGEFVFAAVQQVSSVLRSNLTDELHSRLDVQWAT